MANPYHPPAPLPEEKKSGWFSKKNSSINIQVFSYIKDDAPPNSIQILGSKSVVRDILKNMRFACKDKMDWRSSDLKRKFFGRSDEDEAALIISIKDFEEAIKQGAVDLEYVEQYEASKRLALQEYQKNYPDQPASPTENKLDSASIQLNEIKTEQAEQLANQYQLKEDDPQNWETKLSVNIPKAYMDKLKQLHEKFGTHAHAIAIKLTKQDENQWIPESLHVNYSDAQTATRILSDLSGAHLADKGRDALNLCEEVDFNTVAQSLGRSNDSSGKLSR